MKTTTLTATMRFPFVESFDDYHDISSMRVSLSIFEKKGKTIQYEEIANDGLYWGLFWIKGKKPTSDEIEQLLADAGFNLVHGEICTVI